MHTRILTTLNDDSQLDQLKSQSLLHMKNQARKMFNGFDLNKSIPHDIGVGKFYVSIESNQMVNGVAFEDAKELWDAPMVSLVDQNNFLCISITERASELLALQLQSMFH